MYRFLHGLHGLRANKALCLLLSRYVPLCPGRPGPFWGLEANRRGSAVPPSLLPVGDLPRNESRLLVAIGRWRRFWSRRLAGGGGYRLILEVREHARSVQSHGHGMLEMGAGPPILGLYGP